MTDLRDRFRSLDDLRPPDLWREIEGRAVALPQRSPRPLPWALILAILLLAMALGGAALIGSGVVKLPGLVDASPMPSSPGLGRTWTSPQYGYSLDLPATWIVTPATEQWPGGGGVDGTGAPYVDLFQFGAGSPGSTLRVKAQAIAEGTSSASWLAYWQRTRTIGGQCFGSSGPWTDATVGGLPARYFSWRCDGASQADKDYDEYTFLDGGLGYVITGTPSMVEVFVRSFRVPQTTDRTGSWSATGTMTTARTFPTATRLLDGRVLVTGRRQSLSNPFPSAEIYDPATGTWSATAPMVTLRFHATATLLPDGRVLVAGGGIGGPRALATAELYDPATGTWSVTGSMGEARSGHTATLLADGRVMVAGGYALVDGTSRPGDSLASAEIYDPGMGTWSETGPLAEGRGDHTATRLPDGRVLVAGGYAVALDSTKWGSPLASAELYDPATGTWSATGPLTNARSDHSATLLPNGSVLVTGGSANSVLPSDVGAVALASAELYDPVTGTWSLTASLAEGRSGHAATVLPDGRVLVAGGSANSLWPDGSIPDLLGLASAELYDPIRGTWTAAASMGQGRAGFAAALLENGTVLVAGGISENSESAHPVLAAAELYDPARANSSGPSFTAEPSNSGGLGTPSPTPLAQPTP